MKHISFPSIDQFRTTVATVRARAKMYGCGLPTLEFNGTVKLHGTNAGVVKNLSTGELYAQSRTSVITPDADNAGFARHVADNTAVYDAICNIATGVYGHHRLIPGDSIAVYGEWCGKGINKGAAICQVEPKMFVIFAIRLKHADDEQPSTWFKPEQRKLVYDEWQKVKDVLPACDVTWIDLFKSWTVKVDFSRPDLAQNQFVEITNAVEAECPVSALYGVKGVGEGVVWSCVSDWVNETSLDRGDDGDGTVQLIKTSDLVFKVKGEKHSDTKVKVLAAVDVEKMNDAVEFATRVVTDHRLEKMIELMKQEGLEIVPESTPRFLKLVGQDVMKEEADTLDANGIDRKLAMGRVNQLARDWYINLIKSLPI